MKKLLGLVVGLGAAALLYACGGGGGDDTQPLGVASNTTVAVSPNAAAALISTPFNFTGGVAALGTTADTSVTFKSTSTVPAFEIASGGATASGSTSFGSCVFAVTSSTFPAGHALSVGQTVTVNPCNLNIGTAGALANGVATSRSVALVLGAAASANSSVTVGVSSSGSLTLNGNIVTTVTLTPVSG